MAAIIGRVVKNGDGAMPYKVVLELEDGSVVEHRVASIRAGEHMIREALEIPVQAPRIDPWNP
ncbi:hypothetical protein [Sphingosinicella sp. BN140058]|uniref:hypothetical protein n=1 Tax=Sphingosinicella sp. BN140058 TaxID=1892855 RepID=UPI0010138A99|nr:hypothetical protein [Sphingosinicella sp. BN140058]QAY78610.1 hypothetical protein ETR14_20245 [Sphingosinicella sp. BN140058]